MIKRNTPSRIASYICDGCLKTLSIFGNTTPHELPVGFPYNSPLMKFDILPKKIPIGAVQATRSKKTNALSFFLFANMAVPKIIPIKAPWKDIPPYFKNF